MKPLNKERKKTKLNEVLTQEAPKKDDIILDENDGIRRIGNKNLYLIVLDEYYQENRDALDLLNSSINERHYQDAIQIVHKIKGSSGNIGAKRLYIVASEL